MKIKLNTEIKVRKRLTVIATIEKETAKAVLLKIHKVVNSNVLMLYWDAWLPKSQIKIAGNSIAIPEWLVQKKDLGFLCQDKGVKCAECGKPGAHYCSEVDAYLCDKCEIMFAM